VREKAVEEGGEERRAELTDGTLARKVLRL
jgi:hypothetical protein